MNKRNLRLIDGDAEEQRYTEAELRAAIAEAVRGEPWLIDASPFPITDEEAPDNRTVGVFIVAGGHVVDMELVGVRSAEPEDVARLFVDRLAVAAERAGYWPSEVNTRHESVAPALARLLVERGATVYVQHDVEELNRVIHGAAMALADGKPTRRLPVGPLITSPERWRMWGLPDEAIHRVFDAAVRFNAAAPWALLADAEAVGLELPDRARWLASVMGSGGGRFGMSMYTDPQDFIDIISADPSGPLTVLTGSMITLDCWPRGSIPAAMREEIDESGWPMAVGSYPRLWCLNTPGGGISRQWAIDLALSLDAIARFTTANAGILGEHLQLDEPMAWVDAESGVIVSYTGALGSDSPGPSTSEGNAARPPLPFRGLRPER